MDSDPPLFVGNEDAHAKADVCIVDRLSEDDVCSSGSP